MTCPYRYPLTDTDHFNKDARVLLPDAGEEDDDEEKVTMDAADVANIDALLDLMD